MAKQAFKLTARRVETLREPGRHSDGGGLYLLMKDTGAKSWVFMWKRDGKRREMGLGPLRDVPLVKAREMAAEARRHVLEGRDPLAVRHLAEPKHATFGEVADALIDSIDAGFRNEKHKAQWRATLGTVSVDAKRARAKGHAEHARALAALRAKRVDLVEASDVLAVLKPIWQSKQETASRLRGRIERVLDAAKAQGLRSGENPARWRGHLDAILPERNKLQRGHHAAMPYGDVPAFLERLRVLDSMSARALEFTVLTAARSAEVLGMRWDEIDFEARIWTVPASRMKAGREHRSPLSARALALLARMREARVSDFVFPGMRAGKGLSVMALAMCLRGLDSGVTVHGFRSSFRDWCGEETAFPREIAEQALAHVVGDATERAYRRGDALERRRELMETWSRYLEPARDSNVVALFGA